MVFFLSAVFSVAMILGFMYLSELTKGIKVNGIESEAGKTLAQTVVVSFFVSVCIMVYSVKFYIRSRAKDYSMLLVLGIQKRQFILFVALEYLFSWMLSIVMGLLFGNLIVAGFKGILEKVSEGEVVYSSVNSYAVYGKVFLWCIAMIIGVIVALVVYMNGRDLSILLKGDAVKPKMKVKKIWGWISVGGFVMVVLALLFSRIVDAEYPNEAIACLVVSTIGIYIFLLFGTGVAFERFKQSRPEQYCKKLLDCNNVYSRLTDNINIVAIQIIVGMAFLYFVWTVSGGIWEVNPDKYPYDLVCLAEETQGKQGKKIDAICREYGEDVQTFKTLEIFCEGYSAIGVPESMSEKLWGDTFEVEGKEFAHLWGGTSREWNAFPGGEQRCQIYLGKKNFVHNKGESYLLKEDRKRTALFGQDLFNVIVFSDEEFESLYDKYQGSQSITLMNGTKAEVAKARTELQSLQKGKNNITIQEKETMLQAHKMEGIVRFAIVMFGAVTILFFLLFTLCIKLYSNLPSMKEKYQFLHTMGIQKKEKRKMIKKEVSFLLIPPTWIAVVIGVMHCGAFLMEELELREIPFRFIDTYQNPSFLWILPQAVVYILIMFLFTVIIRNLMVRWIEKE